MKAVFITRSVVVEVTAEKDPLNRFICNGYFIQTPSSDTQRHCTFDGAEGTMPAQARSTMKKHLLPCRAQFQIASVYRWPRSKRYTFPLPIFRIALPWFRRVVPRCMLLFVFVKLAQSEICDGQRAKGYGMGRQDRRGANNVVLRALAGKRAS